MGHPGTLCWQLLLLWKELGEFLCWGGAESPSMGRDGGWRWKTQQKAFAKESAAIAGA